MLDELIDNYIEDNKMWSFESESGVRKFTKLVRDVGGYRSLDEFLADNSGAIEAVVEWMRARNCPEWEENLAAYATEEEAEEGETDD